MAHIFTEEEKAFIKRNVIGIGNKELMEALNREFGTAITYKQILSFKKNHKLSSGLTGTYKPGNVPYNKGKKKWYPGGEETQFRPGNTPHNQVPVGTELIRDDGYLWRKIEEPKTWKQVHRLIWEEANGKIPAGHKVLFVDGDRSNVTLENLMVLTPAEVMIMNKNKLIHADPELTKAGVNVAKVLDKINKLKK